MRIFAKAILKPDQIQARKEFGVDGIELLMIGSDIYSQEAVDSVRCAVDNFPVVNVETGDAVSKDPLYVLVDPIADPDLVVGDVKVRDESRRVFDRGLELLSMVPEEQRGHLVAHYVGKCNIINTQAQAKRLITEPERQDAMEELNEYLDSIDRSKKAIWVETVYPNFLPNGDLTCDVEEFPFGSLPSQFPEGRGMVFDTGHVGIGLMVYRNMLDNEEGDYGANRIFDLTSGARRFQAHFEKAERAAGNSVRSVGLQQVMENLIYGNQDRIGELHLNNIEPHKVGEVSDYVEGHLKGTLNFEGILRGCAPDTIIVPETDFYDREHCRRRAKGEPYDFVEHYVQREAVRELREGVYGDI